MLFSHINRVYIVRLLSEFFDSKVCPMSLFPKIPIALQSLVLWGIFSIPAYAMDINGIKIQDTIHAYGEQPELTLNGASVRKAYLFVDVYIGSLYLEQTYTDAEAIFNDDGYKRMSFYMLRNVRGKRIATALKDAMQVNLSIEEVDSFEKEFSLLIKYMDRTMKEGEEGVVEYIPGKGSKIITGNEVKGIIPGKAFFNAILTSWIGKQPVSSVMKQELLGNLNGSD